MHRSHEKILKYKMVVSLGSWNIFQNIFVEGFRVYLIDLNHEDVTNHALYDKLWNFKHIYYIYFLANILHCLLMLSKLFKHKFVDVSNIGFLIKSNVTYALKHKTKHQTRFQEKIEYTPWNKNKHPNRLLRLRTSLVLIYIYYC